jgi:hypothetical protein
MQKFQVNIIYEKILRDLRIFRLHNVFPIQNFERSRGDCDDFMEPPTDRDHTFRLSLCLQCTAQRQQTLRLTTLLRISDHPRTTKYFTQNVCKSAS